MVWAVSLSTMNLITHSLTLIIEVDGIRSLVGFGSVGTPLAHPVLYLRYGSGEASPIAISGRTSNNEV